MTRGRDHNSRSWSEDLDPILTDCADRALGEADGGDAWDRDTVSLEIAAAAAEIAWMERDGGIVPMPGVVRTRLYQVADEWITKSGNKPFDVNETSATSELPLPFRAAPKSAARPLAAAWKEPSRSDRPAQPRALWSGQRFVPWFIAAASLLIAVLLSARGWSGSVTRPQDPARERAALLAEAPDAIRLDWEDWDNPEIKGVKGDVVWSDKLQKGFMRLVGLPTPGANSQFQLWIIDDTRGMEQRISGGVFECPGGTDECIIPIDAKLAVRKAAAFALTIEQRGGTWVSDMKRRVVIAKAN